MAGGLFDNPLDSVAANDVTSRVYDGPVSGALSHKLSLRRLSLRRPSQQRLSISSRVPLVNTAQATAAATRARIDTVFGAALEMVVRLACKRSMSTRMRYIF